MMAFTVTCKIVLLLLFFVFVVSGVVVFVVSAVVVFGVVLASAVTVHPQKTGTT